MSAPRSIDPVAQELSKKLVERLRGYRQYGPISAERVLMSEAADEIERLQRIEAVAIELARSAQDWGNRVSISERLFTDLEAALEVNGRAHEETGEAMSEPNLPVVLPAGEGFDADRLRAALYVYGGHIPPCAMRPCTCGFLAEWEHAKLPISVGHVLALDTLKELKA